MTSHRGRTWAPKGKTPVVGFNGASRGRVTLAALACYKHPASAADSSTVGGSRATIWALSGVSPGRTTATCSCEPTFNSAALSWWSGTI